VPNICKYLVEIRDFILASPMQNGRAFLCNQKNSVTCQMVETITTTVGSDLNNPQENEGSISKHPWLNN